MTLQTTVRNLGPETPLNNYVNAVTTRAHVRKMLPNSW
eukprot:COSAG02_NODE_55647_length_289_cov_0.978947_1_plen_37_part_10